MSDWQRRHAGLEGLTMSVNISSKQFLQADLVDGIERLLVETGLDPQRLKLELTESTIMTNPGSAAAALDRLRAMGIQVSIDHFGTGHSSLSYLRRFPIDTVKIDRSFVDEMVQAGGGEIVETIVRLAHNLNLEVVAEGVETDIQHRRLKAM